MFRNKNILPFITVLSVVLICGFYGTLLAFNIGKLKTSRVIIKNETNVDRDLKFICQYNYKNEVFNKEFVVNLKSKKTFEFFAKTAQVSRLNKGIITHIKDLHFSKSLITPKYNQDNHEYILVINNDYKENLYEFIPPYRDFDLSLNKGSDSYNHCFRPGNTVAKKIIAPLKLKQLYRFLKSLYNHNCLENVNTPKQAKIPKIIHQIWLGSSLPDKFKFLQETWLKNHPHWTYILWTDQKEIQNPDLAQKYSNYKEKNVKEVGNLVRQDVFDRTNNFGEKSDILRVEILYKLGGLYIDTDFECLEPFDLLHHKYNFYAGIPPLTLGKLQVANGLMAASPKHEILKAYFEIAQSSRELEHIFGKKVSIIVGTGPIALTKAIFNKAGTNNTTDMIFPPTYFYPLTNTQNRLALKQGKDPSKFPFTPEALGVHYWCQTWGFKKDIK